MAIIEELQAAEAGSAELSLAVAKAIGEVPEDAKLYRRNGGAQWSNGPTGKGWGDIIPYTTSHDESWSLLLDDWFWSGFELWRGGWAAKAYPRREGGLGASEQHKDIILAKCIIALKARGVE